MNKDTDLEINASLGGYLSEEDYEIVYTKLEEIREQYNLDLCHNS